MLFLFGATVVFVLLVWGLCSLAEGALYAVSRPYIRKLVQANDQPGKILEDFKDNMERPISAILIVNTVVAAAGATIVGAQANALFGESKLLWCSSLFTLAALVLSEIIPKVLGVATTDRYLATSLDQWLGPLRSCIQ